MYWADIAILGIILISVVISVFRGFMREVLSLLAWVAAFWVATRFAGQASVFLEPYITLASARLVLSYVGVLVLTLIACGMVNFLIAKLLDKTGLTGTDRLLGAVFGFARGGLIVVIAVLFAGLTTVPGDPRWQASPLTRPFETAALFVVQQLPPDIAKYFSY